MSLSVAFRHAFPGHDFDIAFDAPSPGVTALFGPSGAGKSTVAAVVAGLRRPVAGRVVVDGVVLEDSDAGIFVVPERRRIGMVFQDGLLFPHLSVAGNLRYGMNRAGPGRIFWDEIVALLDLPGLLDRRSGSLSGGERQRVAIGRALLAQPRLLVMDEPLAGLDAARRAEIIPYLARLRDRLGLPILYITHALDEVARLADTLVLIEAGQVVAAGPLAEVLTRVDLPFARGEEAGSVLDVIVAGHLPARGLTRLGLAGTELLVPLQNRAVGERVRVRVAAQEVILASAAPAGISVQNILPMRIGAIDIEGANGAAIVRLDLGQARLLARVTRDAIQRLALAPGDGVIALIKSMSVQVL